MQPTENLQATITTFVSLAIAAWALFVAWGTLRATAKQAETAERTRKLSIRPHILAFTRQCAHQVESTYLIIANVGFGSTKNVRIRIVRGALDDSLHGSKPLEEWAPVKRPISVLRVDERLWTILRAANVNQPSDLGPEVCLEVTYSDMEGTPYGPEQLTLDWFPNDGTTFAHTTQRRGSEIVEERRLYPEDL